VDVEVFDEAARGVPAWKPGKVRTPPAWPALPLSEWLQTRDTLQLWLQVVGKVRLQNTPLISHWWNVPLYLTARGLTGTAAQRARN
jgi:hypothetical protein